MSFRLFIYYCALCGGWAAFCGWALGVEIHPAGDLGKAGIRAMFLGICVALGLSGVDAVWNLPLPRTGELLRRTGASRVVSDKDPEQLWTPTALGFVALGVCIGLLIGLAQVILKEAWVKIESGRRAGKEMILAKEKTTIGRAESCDIGLFGD